MFNFPNTPSLGAVYQPVGGPSYTWDGTKWVMSGSRLQQAASFSSRNRIVNGGIQISQENARGGSGANAYFPADQWYYGNTGPTTNLGLSNDGNPDFLQLWNGAGTFSPAAASLNWVQQNIEGNRIVDFGWGTAAALPAVLRFRAWTSTSLVFGVAVSRQGGSHSFVQNFTATSTPTDFVMAVPGATVGTWPTDNTAAMTVSFAAMAGSNYITANSRVWQAGNFLAATGVGNLFAAQSQGLNITNVGLYLDPDGTGLAPRWEMPEEAQELQICKRYWRRNDDTRAVFPTTGTVVRVIGTLDPPMRTAPALTLLGGNIHVWSIVNIAVSSISASYSGSILFDCGLNTASAGTAQNVASLNNGLMALNARM